MQSSSTSLLDATWRSPGQAPGMGSPRWQANIANEEYHVSDKVFTVDSNTEEWTPGFKARQARDKTLRGIEDIDHAAMRAAASLKAASKFKNLKAKAEERRLAKMTWKRRKEEKARKLEDALEKEIARQDCITEKYVPPEVQKLMDEMSDEDEEMSPEEKEKAIAARKKAQERKKYTLRRRKELFLEAREVVGAAHGVHFDDILPAYNKLHPHKELHLKARDLAEEMLKTEMEQVQVSSRAEVAFISDIDTNTRKPHRFHMPPAGTNEEPTHVQLIDARKELDKLIRDRRKLESRHHQKMELMQEQEIARNRKRKAEMDEFMKGQSAGEAMSRAAEAGVQAHF